jgi:hypothetical protein
VEVSRDDFGDVVTMTWRADTMTVMLAACRILRQHFDDGGPAASR